VLLLLLACVHYDRSTYELIAATQAGALALHPSSCEAHRAAAAALADTGGRARALKVPLGTGRELQKLQAEHLWQGRVCDALVNLSHRGELDAGSEARAMVAWGRMWGYGRKLVAGGW
jgi:hypothetical protein